MNSTLKSIINYSAKLILENRDLDELDSISAPIWDEMSYQEKFANIEAVYYNEYNEDFGHSGCCRANGQATAWFLVQYFQTLDLGDFLFDDLDFMMQSTTPEMAEMFGISKDFFK